MNLGSIILGVLLTAIAYMAFPLLLLLLHRGKLDDKRAKKIALWNSIIVGVIFFFLTIVLLGGGIWNAAPAVLYYFINYSLLRDKNASSPAPVKKPTAHVAEEKAPQLSGSNEAQKTIPEKRAPSENVIVAPPTVAKKHFIMYSSNHCNKCNAQLPVGVKFCNRCGTNVVAQAPVNTAKKPSKIHMVITIVVSVIAFLSLTLNAVQTINSTNARSEIEAAQSVVASKEAEIAELNKTIKSQKNTMVNLQNKVSSLELRIGTQRNTINSLQQKGQLYDNIVNGMQQGNAGSASKNFRISDSVIVLGKNEVGRKVTLTANWTKGGTVYVDYSYGDARLSFDKDEWYTSTTKLTVVPGSTGITVATFSNSVNSQKFKVLIIVTG